MEDKLSSFKKEIGERHVNQFIAEILKEKQYFKNEYQRIAEDYIGFQAMKTQLGEVSPEAQLILSAYEEENGEKLEAVVGSVYRAQEIVEQEEREGKDKKRSKIDPNKELIRLLKK